MNANLNGSGRSRRGADSSFFLALIHPIFGSRVDPGCFVYSKNYECSRGLTVKAGIALVQGGKVRNLATGFTDCFRDICGIRGDFSKLLIPF